jgi:signal transduction histidine kinase/ABC-type amino acid transport substrate-binding protein
MLFITIAASGKPRTIIIVGNADCAPYAFIDRNGAQAGFDVELIDAIMKKMHQPYELHLNKWAKSVKTFSDYKADLIISMRKTPARVKRFRFGPTTCYDFDAFVNRVEDKPVTRIDDLKDKLVAVEGGSYANEQLDDMETKIDYITVPGNTQVIESLKNGKSEVGFLTKGVARYIINNNRNFGNITISGTLQTPLEYCIVGHDSIFLNKITYALYELKLDGTYERIYNKWLSYKKPALPLPILVSIIILVSIAVIALLFNRVLRAKVIKASKELEEKNKKMREDALRLKYVLTASNYNTWIFKDGVLTIFNNADNIKAKFTKEEYFSILDDECRAEVEKIMRQMDNGQNGQYKEMQMRTKWKPQPPSNEPMYFLIEGIPIFNEDGSLKYYFGISHDITKDMDNQKLLEEERNKAIESEHLEAAFLANMSHEIRTPLNSILGFTDLMLYDDNKTNQQQYKKVINTNSDLLLQLINDILELSKMEAGVVKLEPEKFDITQLFNEELPNFRLKNENPDVKILCECPHKHCHVTLDRNRTAQIINNFMTNAMKYTKSGHITMGYTTDDTGIKIYVEDTGKGIDDKNGHGRAFRRFEKLDPFVQGIGLGLSICKDIVQMANGIIDYESELGKGTTFWAWFPTDIDTLK